MIALQQNDGQVREQCGGDVGPLAMATGEPVGPRAVGSGPPCCPSRFGEPHRPARHRDQNVVAAAERHDVITGLAAASTGRYSAVHEQSGRVRRSRSAAGRPGFWDAGNSF